MIGMSTILSIRQRLDDGDSVARVARDKGVSEPTVRKYRDMDDFSPSLRPEKKRASKLDPYKPVIDSWLLQDRKRRAKQRHTAKRVHERLVAEYGFDGGYTHRAAVREGQEARAQAGERRVPSPRMGESAPFPSTSRFPFRMMRATEDRRLTTPVNEDAARRDMWVGRMERHP